MVGIVYATDREADPFLRLAGARPLAGKPLPVYTITLSNRMAAVVVISGMGKVAAGIAATYLVLDHRVAVLINAGLCGRLNPQSDWHIGDLLRVRGAVEGDCDRLGCGEAMIHTDSRWFDTFTPARLVTNDRPVFSASQRRQLAAVGDVADMEGAAVARTASLFGIPWAMLKGISDYADDIGQKDIADNIDWLSARIADALAKELERHGQPSSRQDGLH